MTEALYVDMAVLDKRGCLPQMLLEEIRQNNKKTKNIENKI